jgi:hypothetical protein
MTENQNSDTQQQLAVDNFKTSSPPEEMPPEENKAHDNHNPDDSTFNYHSKVGDPDPIGRKIEAIYYSADKRYFIYHIDDYSLQIVAEDATLLSKDLKVNEIYGRILDYLASNPEMKRKYVKSIAFAVKTLYDGNSDVAVNSLEATYNNITRSLRRKAEAAYMGGALILVLTAPIVYLITYKIGTLNNLGHIIFCAAVFSALGGFLSVALNVKKLDVDVQNPLGTIMIYGAQRIFLAMISGVFIYFLIASKIFLAFFEDLQNINVYYVAFFLCGFSERLVPNLMLNFEDKSVFGFKKTS